MGFEKEISEIWAKDATHTNRATVIWFYETKNVGRVKLRFVFRGLQSTLTQRRPAVVLVSRVTCPEWGKWISYTFGVFSACLNVLSSVCKTNKMISEHLASNFDSQRKFYVLGFLLPLNFCFDGKSSRKDWHDLVATGLKNIYNKKHIYIYMI